MNISRHAQRQLLSSDDRRPSREHLAMTITDNGQGLGDDPTPPSIQRRARMLRGKLHIESPVADTGHGTRITLVIPMRTWLPFI